MGSLVDSSINQSTIPLNNNIYSQRFTMQSPKPPIRRIVSDNTHTPSRKSLTSSVSGAPIMSKRQTPTHQRQQRAQGIGMGTSAISQGLSTLDSANPTRLPASTRNRVTMRRGDDSFSEEGEDENRRERNRVSAETALLRLGVAQKLMGPCELSLDSCLLKSKYFRLNLLSRENELIIRRGRGRWLMICWMAH